VVIFKIVNAHAQQSPRHERRRVVLTIGSLPINGVTPHDTSTTDSNKRRTADRTTTVDSTTAEAHRDVECNLISSGVQEELVVVTVILVGKQQARHKIPLEAVTIVPISRGVNPACVGLQQLRVTPAVKLGIFF